MSRKTARMIQAEIFKLQRAGATSLGADQKKIAAQVEALQQRLNRLTQPQAQAPTQPQQSYLRPRCCAIKESC